MTVLKIHYKKRKPLVVTYRDYKKFSIESFRSELLSAMERHNNISFSHFHSEFLYLLDKPAPVKKRYIKANKKNLKNLIKQSWLVLSYLINFWNTKLKKIGFGMLSSATIASNCYSINKRQYFENLNLSSITEQYLHFSLNKMNLRTTK